MNPSVRRSSLALAILGLLEDGPLQFLAGLDDASITWSHKKCTKLTPDSRIDLIHYRTIP
jgi:hypothetical protein